MLCYDVMSGIELCVTPGTLSDSNRFSLLGGSGNMHGLAGTPAYPLFFPSGTKKGQGRPSTQDAAHDADPPISQLRVNEVLSITRAQFRTASGWYKVNKLIHRLTTIQFLSYQAGPPQHHLLIVPDNDKAHPCLVQQDN